MNAEITEKEQNLIMTERVSHKIVVDAIGDKIATLRRSKK